MACFVKPFPVDWSTSADVALRFKIRQKFIIPYTSKNSLLSSVHEKAAFARILEYLLTSFKHQFILTSKTIEAYQNRIRISH